MTHKEGGSSGNGVAFKLSATGDLTVLHTFTGPDGALPAAGLIRDAAGNFYGTTTVGGSASNGTIFKLDTDDEETVLHSFNGSDGALPFSRLAHDTAGNLYGTHSVGRWPGHCLPVCALELPTDQNAAECQKRLMPRALSAQRATRRKQS